MNIHPASEHINMLLTGALAGSVGVQAFPPFLLGLFVAHGGLWAVLVYMTRHKWKREHRI